MEMIKIKERELENSLTAKYVNFETTFIYQSEYFDIKIYFYDKNQTYIGGLTYQMTPKEISEWFELAKQYPEKATFLNFTLVIEWLCQRYNIEIDENT